MNARGEISWTSLDEYESIANQQNEVFKHCPKEKALKILKRVKRNKAKNSQKIKKEKQGKIMLNQIEKQFEGFMQAMYGKQTISQAQESDIEKSFYAGMLVCIEMLHAFDENEDMAVAQLETLYKQIHSKMKQLANSREQKGSDL